MKIAHPMGYIPAPTLPPRALCVDDTAYWVGKPEVTIPGDVDDIHVSPDRRYLLAICRTPRRQPFEEEEDETDLRLRDAADRLPRHSQPRTGTVSVIAYDSERNRVFPLWKRKAKKGEKLIVSDLCWLADSRTAMSTVSIVTLLPKIVKEIRGRRRVFQPVSLDVFLMILSVPDRTVRTVPLLENNPAKAMIQILPALTENRVLLTVAPKHDDAWQSCFVDDKGNRSETIPIEVNMANLSGWTPGDAKVVGFAQPNSRSGWTGVRDIEIDGASGAVTLIERTPTEPRKAYEKPSIPERQASAYDLAMPVLCFSETIKVAPPEGSVYPFTASPIYIGTVADLGHRVMVVPDGDPVCILGTGDTLSLLYRAHDALYRVSLEKTARAKYESAVRRVSRQRAFSLKTSLAVWRLQHANRFPEPGADVVALLAQPNGNPPTADFDDPLTGKLAFTYLYSGASNNSVPLFSLASIGGRFVCYTASLTPHWVPDGSPIPGTEPESG